MKAGCGDDDDMIDHPFKCSNLASNKISSFLHFMTVRCQRNSSIPTKKPFPIRQGESSPLTQSKICISQLHDLKGQRHNQVNPNTATPSAHVGKSHGFTQTSQPNGQSAKGFGIWRPQPPRSSTELSPKKIERAQASEHVKGNRTRSEICRLEIDTTLNAPFGRKDGSSCRTAQCATDTRLKREGGRDTDTDLMRRRKGKGKKDFSKKIYVDAKISRS